MRSLSPSSASSSSSATPEKEVAAKPTKASKGKKSTAVKNGKNEGVDPNWAYKPPRGSALVENEGVDAGEFDWDAVNDNEDVELWLIRVPESVKPKYFENIPVYLPRSADKSDVVGQIKRKHTTFDIWSVGEGEDAKQPVFGEEIKGLSCLLPRKNKKGKLYPAPKPIARHLVVAAPSVSATAPPPQEAAKPKNPPREYHPQELLTHTFMPIGSLVGVAKEMDVDAADPTQAAAVAPTQTTAAPAQATPASPRKSARKRKGEEVEEAPSPKKSRKSKTAS